MKTNWEYDLVERPFCQQLRVMGWQWLEGDTDVPELTERINFREVLLKDRLKAALRRINPGPDWQPWLDDARIERAIRDLEHLGAHRLMEANQAATQLLLQGTSTEGRPDWDRGRPQPLRFIDFDNWQNNDFLVINQFKVELSSGRGHVIPDAVLFVNGIPLVVTEFKSPGIENPLGEAINQLLRYSNQRKELYPTQFTDFLAQNPAYARKMSEKLEEILRRFKDDWDTLERELRRFIQDLRKGPTPIPGAPNITVPFILLIADQLGGWDSISDSQKSKVVQVTVEMVERIQQEVRKVGFWRNLYAREVLTKALVRDLDTSRLFPPGKERDLAQQLVALAKENHENLTR